MHTTVVYRNRLVSTPEIVRRARALPHVCNAAAPTFRYLDCTVETHEVEELIRLHELRAAEPAKDVEAFLRKFQG